MQNVLMFYEVPFQKRRKMFVLNSSETLNKSSNVASIQKTLIVPEMLRDLYQF